MEVGEYFYEGRSVRGGSSTDQSWQQVGANCEGVTGTAGASGCSGLAGGSANPTSAPEAEPLLRPGLILLPDPAPGPHTVDVTGVPPGKQADPVTAFPLVAGRCPSSTAARDRASLTVELTGHAP